MVDAIVAVRRLTITDGVDDLDNSLSGVINANVKDIKLVPVAVHQDGVTYDIYITYANDGSATLEFGVISNVQNEGEDNNSIASHDIGASAQLASDIHKRDATNGRVITNIAIVHAA